MEKDNCSPAYKRMMEDLSLRGDCVMFVVSDKGGGMRAVSYNEDGSVEFVTRKVKAIAGFELFDSGEIGSLFTCKEKKNK